MEATEDPRGFLARHPPPVIIDEIQYVPELLSYIKTRIDENRRPSQWLFTGSQNFVLMKGVSQSLAGRVAVLSLLPFSFSERIGRGEKTRGIGAWLKGLSNVSALGRPAAKVSLEEIALRGSYPEIASNRSVDRQLWCGSYISTYLERDVRNLTQVGDLNQFERFLRMCAIRTGQFLNLSEMAQEVGISVPTAKRWLSILETGYQVFLLYPYYRNMGKRLVKRPKLYFTDTALATYMLGVHDGEALLNSPSFGSLFETVVVTDLLKRYLHAGELPSMYYLRTRDGLEVDLVVEYAQRLYLFEIKSAMTLFPKHVSPLARIAKELGPLVRSVGIISRVAESGMQAWGVRSYAWKDVLAV